MLDSIVDTRWRMCLTIALLVTLASANLAVAQEPASSDPRTVSSESPEEAADENLFEDVEDDLFDDVDENPPEEPEASPFVGPDDSPSEGADESPSLGVEEIVVRGQATSGVLTSETTSAGEAVTGSNTRRRGRRRGSAPERVARGGTLN